MRTYFTNSRMNKAAIIMATMSPDMQADIVELCTNRGPGLLNDLSAHVDGPPKPMAIFSRKFMSDDDFPSVFMGWLTINLAQMRSVKADFDFYEKTLQDAFALPGAMASAIAKNIETLDIINGSEEGAKKAWYMRWLAKAQEGIRLGANWVTEVLHLPLENDQTQAYDIDMLYEWAKLGQAVEELMKRGRLMTAQTNISHAMGMFVPASSTQLQKQAGDVSGDPVEQAEQMIGDALKPLIGTPLPLSLLGGVARVFGIGQSRSKGQLARLLSEAGIGNGSSDGGDSSLADPALRQAFANYMSGNLSPRTKMAAAGRFNPALRSEINEHFVSPSQNSEVASAMGDVAEHIRDAYGEPAANAWAQGDLPALVDMAVNEGSAPLATTGDPQLDEHIIGDVLSEQSGDPFFKDSLTPEIGGLFTRWRINSAIRRGNRRARRASRKNARSMRRARQTEDLNQALDYARSAGNASAVNGSDVTGGMDSEWDNSPDQPDDVYNLGSVETPTE